MSLNSVKQAHLSKQMFAYFFQQYFDNHARNDNLSESSFFLPFRGNSSNISGNGLPWIKEIKDIKTQDILPLWRKSILCRKTWTVTRYMITTLLPDNYVAGIFKEMSSISPEEFLNNYMFMWSGGKQWGGVPRAPALLLLHDFWFSEILAMWL